VFYSVPGGEPEGIKLKEMGMTYQEHHTKAIKADISHYLETYSFEDRVKFLREIKKHMDSEWERLFLKKSE